MSAPTTITGRLGKDPELRFGAGGRAVCSFTVASDRRWKDSNNEWQSVTSWFTCVAYGSLAENIAASLHKGDPVIVSGRIEQRSYETQEGEKRTVVEIQCDEVGPGLKFATVEVQKVRRDDGSGHQRSTGSRSRGVNDDYPGYGDEEPFVDLDARRADFRNLALTERWL